jgi:hypothetical protein
MMSFRLKNADATYQRAIQACFKRQLNKNNKAYVYDVVIKTSHPNTLVTGLEETFALLRDYQWELNPNKYVFSVPPGQLLGYITSHCGIEANFKKVTTITSMSSPTTIKDVQKLTGCLEALNPFISRLRERGLPFSKLLNWQEKFMWTEEVDQVLQQL